MTHGYIVDQTVPVGKMHINRVEQLLRLDVSSDKLTHIQPSLADLDTDSDNDDPISGQDLPESILTGQEFINMLVNIRFPSACSLYWS